jgi:hypothetical protein
MGRNIADSEQVKNSERSEKRKMERDSRDFRSIMETQPGRRFVAHLLDFCGFQKSSFTGNSTTFFNEGKREVALELWRQINMACPDLYFQMIEDAKEPDNV